MDTVLAVEYRCLLQLILVKIFFGNDLVQ